MRGRARLVYRSIDCLPDPTPQPPTQQVPKDKYEKLLAFVKKIYVQLGTIVEGGLQMPLDEASGSTLGFAFVNFASREEAEKAIAATNNWNFDKAHALKVCVWVWRGVERWGACPRHGLTAPYTHI